MIASPIPPAPHETGNRDAQQLLKTAPRALELGCALLVGVLAGLLFYDFLIHRWFYFEFHQYYRSTPESRAYDWYRAICDVAIGAWLAALALDLARGSTRRRDGGLFSPAALRLCGVLFALLPLGLLVFDPGAALHFHLFAWCWSAAIACFALATRRARAQANEDRARPIE